MSGLSDFGVGVAQNIASEAVILRAAYCAREVIRRHKTPPATQTISPIGIPSAEAFGAVRISGGGAIKTSGYPSGNLPELDSLATLETSDWLGIAGLGGPNLARPSKPAYCG
jgi:hypothetical protein